MRASFAAAVGLLFIALVTSGCGGSGVAGSGNVQTQTRDVPGFDSVNLTGIGTVTIMQTGVDSLKIQADDNVLPLLTSDVAGTTLRLGLQPGTNIRGGTTINYLVTVRALHGVILSGAGDLTATNVDSPFISVANGGTGRIVVSGRASSQQVSLVGAGQYDGSGLISQDADVTLSGTGDTVVNVSGTLNAHVTGVGSVEYVGNPRVTQQITGIGTVRKR